CLIPMLGVIRQTTASVAVCMVLAVWGAGAFGALFPILCDAAVRTGSRAGMGVGYLYAANIAGCTAGSLVTGLVLLDHLTVGDLSLLIALVQLASAATVVPLVAASG